MTDRGARPVVVAGGQCCLHVVLVAGRDAEADHIDRQIDALFAHRRRHIQRRDALCELLGDGDFGERAHERKRTPPPKLGMRLIAITTAKVITSIMMPSTAIAPRSPDSLRSKI